MPQRRALKTEVPWVQLNTTREDWRRADPGLLVGMLVQLHLIRAFEEAVLELATENLVHGPAHASIGQEGGAVGSIIGLRSSDGIAGSHRGHHQFLAKALGHVAPGYLTLEEPVPPVVQQVLQRTLAEILGLAQGFSGGRGGSMHLQWLEAGALGTNAIVGGGVPFAAGNAWAQNHAGTSDATIAYFGDGSAQIGSVLETLNLAAAWKLPICFFIENNLYAVSTNIDRGSGRQPVVRPRPGLRHPSVEGRRNGSVGRAPGHPGSPRQDAGRRRAGGHRGRRLPLPSPERPLSRECIRVPHQGRGERNGAPATRSNASPQNSRRCGYSMTRGSAGCARPRRPPCSRPWTRCSRRVRTRRPRAASGRTYGQTRGSSTSASAATESNWTRCPN